MITSTLVILALGASKAKISGSILLGKSPAKSAVVFIESYGSPKPTKGTIEQKDKKFVPRIMVVPIGSTVSFPNRDAVYHNVFAEYNAKKFDLGMYPKGQSRSVTFDNPGVVSILCNVHADMSAYIVVVNSTIYTITDAKGNYTLTGIEPGTYKVQAWHESGAKSNQIVTVTGQDQSLDISLKK